MAGAAGIAYYSIGLFTQSAGEIVVPKLIGKNIIYVLETLTNMGLNAKLYGTRYDDALPRYAVLSQDPQPGATIKKGRDVVIYISKGKKENIVPDLRQIPLNQAGILLEENEFKKGQVSFTYSSFTRKDSIIAQYPDPFSTALKGRACDLLVSRGERPVGMVMPDIKGLRLEMAAGIMDDLDLGISDIASDRDPLQDMGVVLSFTPQAGSRVTKDTPIALVVNHLEKNQHMTPDRLSRSVFLTYSLEPGFLKRHVRVETDMFGPVFDLYNEYMKPGQDIRILVVPGTRANVSFFIDHTLVKTIHIDPWKADNTDNTIGEPLLWESSPLQFYHVISPDWVKN